MSVSYSCDPLQVSLGEDANNKTNQDTQTEIPTQQSTPTLLVTPTSKQEHNNRTDNNKENIPSRISLKLYSARKRELASNSLGLLTDNNTNTSSEPQTAGPTPTSTHITTLNHPHLPPGDDHDSEEYSYQISLGSPNSTPSISYIRRSLSPERLLEDGEDGLDGGKTMFPPSISQPQPSDPTTINPIHHQALAEELPITNLPPFVSFRTCIYEGHPVEDIAVDLGAVPAALPPQPLVPVDFITPPRSKIRWANFRSATGLPTLLLDTARGWIQSSQVPYSIRDRGGLLFTQDVDVFIFYRTLREACAHPGVFGSTFKMLFGIPGLATQIIARDIRICVRPSSAFLCSRLPTGEVCPIEPSWGHASSRLLLQWLVNRCGITPEDIELRIEPFVTRLTGNLWWNPYCWRKGLAPASLLDPDEADWYHHPQRRSGLVIINPIAVETSLGARLSSPFSPQLEPSFPGSSTQLVDRLDRPSLLDRMN